MKFSSIRSNPSRQNHLSRILAIRSLVVAVFCAAAVVCTTPVFAEVKIATVDLARLLNDSPDAATKKKELDQLASEAKKKAEARMKELKSLEASLKDAKVAADSKEAENFRTQARDYERFVKDTEDDIKKRFMKVNKEMSERALTKIAAYAKANNIDLVLDKSEKYRGPVLYGTATTDITEVIAQGLNQ